MSVLLPSRHAADWCNIGQTWLSMGCVLTAKTALRWWLCSSVSMATRVRLGRCWESSSGHDLQCRKGEVV